MCLHLQKNTSTRDMKVEDCDWLARNIILGSAAFTDNSQEDTVKNSSNRPTDMRKQRTCTSWCFYIWSNNICCLTSKSRINKNTVWPKKKQKNSDMKPPETWKDTAKTPQWLGGELQSNAFPRCRSLNAQRLVHAVTTSSPWCRSINKA